MGLPHSKIILTLRLASALARRFRGQQAKGTLIPSPDGTSAASPLPALLNGEGSPLPPAPASAGPASASAPLPAPRCCIGVAMVEVCKGAYASPPCPLLVVDDPAVAEEVCGLASCVGECGAGEGTGAEAAGRRWPRLWISQSQADDILVDLGLVLQHLQHLQQVGTRNIPADQPGAATLDESALRLKARRLLSLACDMGWPSLVSRLLPFAAADGSDASSSREAAIELIDSVSHAPSLPATTGGGGGGAVAQGLPTDPPLHRPPASHVYHSSITRRLLDPLTAPPSPPGDNRVTLLHRAVRSRCPATVSELLRWGEREGHTWRGDRRGPAGLTPLHLAACLERADVALMLMERSPPSSFTRQEWARKGVCRECEYKCD